MSRNQSLGKHLKTLEELHESMQNDELGLQDALDTFDRAVDVYEKVFKDFFSKPLSVYKVDTKAEEKTREVPWEL